MCGVSTAPAPPLLPLPWMLLSVWKFGTASGFYTQTKFGMEGLFLWRPVPRHGGSEILAVVKKVTKHGVVLESWAEGFEGLCSVWACQHKGVGHPQSKLFLWHNRVTGLLFRLGAARNKFSVCLHQKLVNVNGPSPIPVSHGTLPCPFPSYSSLPLSFPARESFQPA